MERCNNVAIGMILAATPSDSGALSALDRMRASGRAALADGDARRLREIAAALLGMSGGRPEGLFLLGLAEDQDGRLSAALPLVAEAAALEPCAEYAGQHARLLVQARRDADARAAAATAEALGPIDALTFDTIGCVWTRLGEHSDAVRLFRHAVALAPDNLEFRYNLGAALSFVGLVAEAEAEFEIIIAEAPIHGRAHYALAGLRRAAPDRNHIVRLEAALTRVRAHDDRLRIQYALAKECEESSRPDEAFEHLRAANEAHRGRIGYDFEQDAMIFDAIERLFERENPLAGDGVGGSAPIFVVGMPRTGTTLVDRILSSHPDVRSAGELQAMPLAVKQLAGSGTRRIIDPETIAGARGIDAARLGQLYLARAIQHVGPDAARFTDKLPANFLYLGFIARALPEARIVCLRRDPMDTIWSNYKHLFASTSPYYAYSYDPVDTARYWLRFDRLMAFWRSRLAGRLLELGYEDLVADQESETRRLLAHCGLRWSDACLDFQTNQAPVATPSASQVRRPINADAIGRWRLQARRLAPARELLNRSGFAIDG